MPNSINGFSSRMERTEEKNQWTAIQSKKNYPNWKTEDRLKKQTNKASGIYSKTTKRLTFL